MQAHHQCHGRQELQGDWEQHAGETAGSHRMSKSSLEVIVNVSHVTDRHARHHTLVGDPLAVSLALDVLSAVQLLSIDSANGSDLAEVVVLATVVLLVCFICTPANMNVREVRDNTKTPCDTEGRRLMFQRRHRWDLERD
jgi:hypothetical protein